MAPRRDQTWMRTSQRETELTFEAAVIYQPFLWLSTTMWLRTQTNWLSPGGCPMFETVYCTGLRLSSSRE